MKRTSSPRQRFTLEERRTLLAAFRDGQLSARDFVRQHGFSLATLYRWQVRPTGGAGTAGFIPVTNPLAASAPPPAYHLRWPSGLSLELAPGFNPRELAALLPLLR
jgi:transposase-like protein